MPKNSYTHIKTENKIRKPLCSHCCYLLYGWGNTAGEVDNTIISTSERVQNNNLKHNAGMAANIAGAETFNSKEEYLTSPKSTVPMDSPNEDSVTGSADDIRNRNRTEESGKGSVHTTAGELAKDIAGLNKDTPPKPTHDFYRNQSFYHKGNLVQPIDQEGIVFPSGRVIYGESGEQHLQLWRCFLRS